MKNILCVFGTRPEAIKMAPIIKALLSDPLFSVKVCVTGQHKEMLDSVLRLFQLPVDYNLGLMKSGQSLEYLTSEILCKTSQIIQEVSPDWVLVHGDTTTTMAASLAAYYNRVPVAHVEAGLRTGQLLSPWPEEANRKLTGALAQLHFAPTEVARENLLREGVAASCIHITGNTVIDSLLSMNQFLTQGSSVFDHQFSYLDAHKKLILVTGHRRENFGPAFREVLESLKELVEQRNVEIVYPVHFNPNVREPVNKILSGHPFIHLIEPLDYLPFVYLMKKSFFIVTDSGGIQEEAPALGKPVIVTRETTERPEAVRAGVALLTGTDKQKILEMAFKLIDSVDFYQQVAQAHNPYGDGRASQKIVEVLRGFTASF